MTPRRMDTVLVMIMVICTVFMTGLVGYRQLFDHRPHSTSIEPKLIDNWQSLVDIGPRVGPPNARVKVIEFIDFECPACSAFDKSLESVRKTRGERISVTFVHYPLPMHKYAVAAALAAQCASEQGRFAEMKELLFSNQDKFSSAPWMNFAGEANVPDLKVFSACLAHPASLAKIEIGKRWAKRLEILGTPTVIVNGWNIGGVSGDQFAQAVESASRGDDPPEL